jgi:hypothetical protein
MNASSLTILPALLLALGACRGEPELNCERVRFGWPNFEVDPADDVSAAEGIQINFSVRSDLLPNAPARLSIAVSGPEGDEDQVLVAETRSQSDGLLTFTDVTVPLGPMIFFIDAEDECGKARTGKRTFVWDGLGMPHCELRLASEPESDPETGSFELVAAYDEDENTPGMQVEVLVDAGRPDMQISLFVVDREGGANQEFDLPAGDDDIGQQAVTLAEGEQALRAVCYWEPQDFRVSTATRVYFVDSTP